MWQLAAKGDQARKKEGESTKSEAAVACVHEGFVGNLWRIIYTASTDSQRWLSFWHEKPCVSGKQKEKSE